MEKAHVKFATQVDPEILAAVKGLARKEGRQIQALVDEALADLVNKRKGLNARPHVMAAYMQSHETYAPVYEKLAK
jgi:hypothetical protein